MLSLSYTSMFSSRTYPTNKNGGNMGGVKIWMGKLLFAADLFINFKENRLIVARNLNFIAFRLAFAHSCYLLFSGIMTMTFLGIFTCFFPSLVCLATEILFKK